MKRFPMFAALVSVLLGLLLVGCSGSSSSSGPTATYPTTSMTVRAGDSASSSLSVQPLAFAGSFTQVTHVSVTVSGEDQYGQAQNPLTSADLTLGSDGVWAATISNLPVGPTLTFTASGTDDAGNELFSGTTTQVLSGTNDSVGVALAPVSDNAAVLFPIVNSITLPAQVPVSSNNTHVSVGVTGSTGETLHYQFTAQDGTYSPTSGTIGLAATGNTGTIVTTFAAPDSPASLTQSVRVTNSQGNAVVTDFPTNVVYGESGTGVSVGFAPVITGITGQRSGNDVTWTATATDDSSALQYTWAFAQDGDGTTAFSTDNANPGVMSNYDESVTGTVSLTVTDPDNLSTTVTFTLVAGQFPNTVVVTTP